MRNRIGPWLATAQEYNLEIGVFVLTILLVILVNLLWSLW